MNSMYQPYRSDAFEPWESLSFLVVDDDKCVRDVVAQQLRLDGYFADSTSNGPAALAKLGERAFDILITDETMPVMRGAQLAKLVKNKWPATAVILVTGFGKEEFPFCPNVDVVLGKPILRSELHIAIARAQESVLSKVELC